MEEEEVETTGIPELANGMETPRYPSAANVPENMKGIRMAPSDNSLQESGDGFCERHDDHNQTIPKVLWGAPRKEKGDSPKADPNSSDKRGPEPDSSLPSIPSIPRSGTNAAVTVAQNNRKKSKEKKGRKKLEGDLLPGKNSAVDPPPRPKSKQRILEDVEQEKSRAKISLDNRLVEELNSLHLQKGEVKDICDLAQNSGNAHEFLKGVCNSLEKFRSLTRSNLPGSMVESGEAMKSLLLDSLGCFGKIKDEIEKQEMEDPEKENEGDCSKDMELRSQPSEKQVAMERAHNLWQNNRLTDQSLFHIYCCYQEQDFVSRRDQLGKLDKCNNLSGLRQSLNLTTSLDYQSGLKRDLSSIITLGKKEETSGPESSQECHLGELMMGDERSVRSAEPVEQSFSFPTSMGYQTLPLTGIREPIGFAQATKCLEAAALFIIRSMLMEFGNRPECKISDHEDLRGCSKDVEKGETEVAWKEKMLEKGSATDGDKEPELETVDAVEENAPEPVVLEKSDFEENEKGKKEKTSADPDQDAADIPPPNMSEDFKEDPINQSSKEAPLPKQDEKGDTQNRKTRKPEVEKTPRLPEKKREKVGRKKSKSSNKLKSGFLCAKGRKQKPEPISTVPTVTDLKTSRATDEKNTGMEAARDSDIQTTDALPTKELLLNEKAEIDISEKNVCSQKTLAPEHALQESDCDSSSEKDREEKEDTLQTEDTFAHNTLHEDQDAAGDDDDDDDDDARVVEAERNHLLELESNVQNAQQGEDLTQNLDVTVVDHNPELNRTHEDYTSDFKQFPLLQKRMTACLTSKREQETYPAATKEIRKHYSLEFQTLFDKKEGTLTAAPAGLTKALARMNPAHGKLLNILTAGQLLPLPKDENDYLPRKPSRVDVQGAVFVVIATSDTASGGSGGKGQGDNSVNSGSRGGDGSGQSWAGARPKTTRNGSNGGGGRDDEDEDRRPPTRNLPLDLPLGSDVASVENPQNQGVVPPDDFKRRRKKQHGAISNEELCQCLGQAGSGIENLRPSSRARELNRCLLLCLHETSSVTSPSPQDLTCCTCAILHSLLSHFTNSAHDSGECSMCQQLFTLVQFHVQECLAWRREGEEEEEDLSLNVCHKMRQAGLFAEEGVTAASPRVWMKVRKYLSAALGPVILLDITTQGGEFGQLELHERTEPLPHTTNSTTMDPHPHSLPSPRTKSAPEQIPPEGLTQNGAAVATSTSLPHTTSEFSQAVMPKPAQGHQLRRRLSTKVIPQRTIPEEPPSPRASSVPPASPVTETEDVFKVESVKMKVETIVTLPSKFPQRAPETPDEQEEIMEIIRSYGKRRREEVSRKYSDDPYSTQRVYGGAGTMSMPEPQNRPIRVEQNFSVEMKPIGVPGIGEVVYGTRQQLLLIARNWAQERDECKASGKCRYQHREEGVILHPFKKKLKILHTRYQKHLQWERLIHLGNGVTGKCHLCIDRSTDFKFCCKKMHILQYEDQELEIWSELSHPHIVNFYGAIRHGEKIYLFAEFIDGGSLAALIKEQWTVGKRLSHWMALNYFRQLLHVLTYLESMGVLHEDIKADNLLVRQGTTEIILADFGAAQQIPQDHTPPNRHPTGSPAHWSPEKAASEGHGFPSDLWACACVLIHMLSGSPPWIIRYPNASILNFLIWSKPAPIEDVPDNVKDNMRDLISCCLVKDKAIRPTAQQILLHPAFQQLDQSGYFFSTFAQPVMATQASGPVVTATTAYQPHQEAHEPQQASWEEGTAGGSSLEASITTSVEMQAPPISVNITTSLHSLSGVRVVEVPRESLNNTSPGIQSELQSLPASFPTRAVDGNRGETSGRVAAEEGSTSLKKRPERRSAPSVLPSSSPQGSSEGSVQHCHQRRKGVVVVTSSVEMTVLGRQGGVESESAMQTTTSTVYSHTGVRHTPVEQDDVVKHKFSTQNSAAAQQKGNVPLRSKSADELMPEPLPEMPLPVLTLASEFTTKMQHITLSVGPSSSQFLYATSQMRNSGPTSLPVGKMDALSRAKAQQSVSAPTLQVPPPSSLGGSRGSETSPSNSLGDRENQNSLLSHGGRSLGSFGSYETELPQTRLEMGSDQVSAAAATPEGAEPAAGQAGQSVGGYCGMRGEPAFTSTRGWTPTLVTIPLELPGKLLDIPPPAESRRVEHSSYQTASAEPPITITSRNTSAAFSTGTSSHSHSTSRANTGVASRTHTINPFQTTIPTTIADASNPFQATVTSTPVSGQHAENQAVYPVLPPLTAADIQLPSPVHGGRHYPMLSMITEERESLMPSTQTSESMGSSDDDMISNYIQDQFMSCTPGGQDSFLQSLTDQAGHRPRLEVYPSPPGTESTSVDLQHMPNFHLLSLQSDSSTLRSGRNTFTSEEMQAVHYSLSAVHAAGGSAERSSPRPAPSAQQGYSAAQRSMDEPDRAHARHGGARGSEAVHAEAANISAIQPGKAGGPLARVNSDEDPISSGDLFGSGPGNNKDFQEAVAYRQEQQQASPHHQQQQLQQQQPASLHIHQSSSAPSLLTQPAPTPEVISPRLARKNPNLRLDVSHYQTSTPTRPTNRGEVQRTSQSSAPPDSAQSQQTQGSDDAFMLNTGVSPLTASPLVVARQTEGRSGSRNESGSSTSTPRSSTYDKQEQEWTNLQLQTPGFDILLAQDPMIGSVSELSDVSSNHHLSMLYDQQGESTSDQEESSILFMLQEAIGDENLRGNPLTFTNPEGQTLFNMRISGRNKAWKELANTFRAQLYKAGFRHFLLKHEDGVTVIDCFSTFDPAIITSVKVFELEEENDISSVCWCADHLVY